MILEYNFSPYANPYKYEVSWQDAMRAIADTSAEDFLVALSRTVLGNVKLTTAIFDSKESVVKVLSYFLIHTAPLSSIDLEDPKKIKFRDIVREYFRESAEQQCHRENNVY